MIDKKLSRLATDIINANGALMEEVLIHLPDDRKRQLDALINNNGRVGFECTTNLHAENRILLVGITVNNKRLVLAEVKTPSAAFNVGATMQ